MSSSAFTPSTTTVTNNVPVNVPVVTDWQSYTPTLNSTTSVTTTQAYYRRVGDSIDLAVTVNYNGVGNNSLFSVTIPSGLTIDTSKPVSGPTGGTVGFADIRLGGTGNRSQGSASIQGLAPTTVSVSINGSNNYFNTSVSLLEINLFARFPISQWAGSGTTTLATRAVEEYAWNSDTTDASTTASGFSNGPSGVLVGSFTAFERIKRVRFTTPISSTDSIFIEINDGNGWINGAQLFTYITQGTSRYGVIPVQFNSTDVDVKFQQTGSRPTNPTYAGAGDPWSTFSTYRWRLRKVSGGAQVGYPVSARNIVGDTSGTVVPTGMIGEELISTSGSAVALTNNTFATIASITLTSGTWDISAFGTWQNTATQATGNQTMNMAISTVAASNTGSTAGLNYAELYGVSAKSGYAGVTLSIPPNRVIVSSNTQRFLCIRFFADAAGSGNQAIGTIRATRIA